MKDVTQNKLLSDKGGSADGHRESETSKIARFKAWRIANVPDRFFLIALAVVTGVACGCMAYVFKLLISCISGLFIPHISDSSINWWLIPLPVVGIALTIFFTRYVVRTNLTHGVAQLIHDIREKTYKLRRNICFSPVVGGSMTLGMGGSAGAEGPIAYTGAAIGSNIGQMLGLDSDQLKSLVGCGASAGIAGIFVAPVGGMMFGFELLRIPLSVNAVIAVASSCLASYLTIFTLMGSQVDLGFSPSEAYSPEILPMAICLGIFCGLYCLYYNMVSVKMDTYYRKVANPWRRGLIGGIIIGVIVFLFPSMFSVGYPVIGDIINGDDSVISHGSLIRLIGEDNRVLMLAAGAILVCKCWAVSSTTSAGGVAGDFAPTLFAGSMAGFLFASLGNTFFSLSLPVGTFAYLGMAGVMAGAIEAPLMTIFITMEMTGRYEFSLPLTICAVTSFFMVRTCGWIFGHHHRLIVHHWWFHDRKADAGGSPD